MPLKNIILCISEFLATSSSTVLSSFYPGLALTKGIPLWLIGIIFSIGPLSGLPVTILAGKHMKKLGRRFMLIIGMSFGAFGIFLLGFLESTDYSQAVALSVSSRVMTGIGAGCSMTAAPSILISEYPGDTDKVIGYYEAASGLGLLAGPLIGSIFTLFSISISFFITAGFYVSYIIAAMIVLRKLKPDIEHGAILRFRAVVFKPKLFFNFCAQFWLLFSLGYLSTIIEIHLETFGFGTFMVGVVFSVAAGCYFITSLFGRKISRVVIPQCSVCVGILGVGVAFLFIGPWSVIGRYLGLVIAGLGLLGVMGALMYIPTPGLMLKQASIGYGMAYNNALLDSISAFTIFFSNLGEVVGPFLAGFISDWIGIDNGCSLVGVLSLLFGITYAGVMWKCTCGEVPVQPNTADDYSRGNFSVDDVNTSKVYKNEVTISS